MNTGLKYAGTLLGGGAAGGAAGYAMGQSAGRNQIDPEKAIAIAYMTIKSQNPEMSDDEAINLAVESLVGYQPPAPEETGELGYEGM